MLCAEITRLCVYLFLCWRSLEKVTANNTNRPNNASSEQRSLHSNAAHKNTAPQISTGNVPLRNRNDYTVPNVLYGSESGIYPNQNLASDKEKSQTETPSLQSPANISKTKIRDPHPNSRRTHGNKLLTPVQNDPEESADNGGADLVTQNRNRENAPFSKECTTTERKFHGLSYASEVQKSRIQNPEHLKRENNETEELSSRSENRQQHDNRRISDLSRKENHEMILDASQSTGTSRQIELDHTSAMFLKNITETIYIPEDELKVDTESVSIPKYPRRNQVSGTHVDEMFLNLVQWRNSSWKNRQKRRKREVADGDAFPSRQPVEFKVCRCIACVTTKSTYSKYAFENVAFNKPANSSSRHRVGRHYALGGCGAVNGNTDARFTFAQEFKPNCFHTAFYDKYPWWVVDLLYVFSIKTMMMVRRQSQVTGGFRMAGVNVRVDGTLCFSFGHYSQADKWRNLKIEYTIRCGKALTGRTVRFEKVREVATLNLFFLHFCEVQIWVCKVNTYGDYPRGCKKCPDKCKYTCDNLYGCDKRVLHNVALNKPVTPSDPSAQGSAHYATDGTVIPITDRSCAFSTKSTRAADHFISVNLKAYFRVFSITLWARWECCSRNELTYFALLVSNYSKPRERTPPRENCNFIPGYIQTTGHASFTCIRPRIGQFVHVHKIDYKKKYKLTICEIEVMGHPRYILDVGAKCIEGSETAICLTATECEKGRCRISLQNPCKNDQPCTVGNICDRGRCKKDIGTGCDPSKSNCRSGSTCDPVSRKCRKGLYSRCSKSQCTTGTVCDALYVCKVKVSKTCRNASQCVAGAKCSGNKCVCDTSVGLLGGDHCKPAAGRVGSACSAASDCQYGKCKDGKCVCDAGLSTVAEDFSCKLKAGSPCENDGNCTTGLKCENSKCRVKIGGNCYSNYEFCIEGTTCETDTCKWKAGQSCVNHKDLCLSGNVCSAGTCKIQLGENCENAKDQCVVGVCSSEDSNTCKIDAGHNCTADYEKQCRSRAICENYQVCKTKLGEPCTSDSTCVLGTVCGARQGSSDKKCRLPIRAEGCTSDEDCVDGTVCDHENQCKISKNNNCKDNPQLCLSGAVCTDGTCQCDQKLTKAGTEKCDPKTAVVGGPCNVGSSDQPCSDSIALCGADHRCHCPSNYRADPVELTCRVSPGFPCSTNTSDSDIITPCATGAACEDGFCLLEVGESCARESRSYCKIGTLCDADEICRLNLRQNCSSKESSCRLDAICDPLKRCKLKPGAFCRSDEDCMAGAHCENGTCVCTETVSKLVQGTCEAIEGLPTGKCKNGECQDTHAQCNNQDKCQCQPEYIPDPNSLSCKKVLDGKCTEDSECVTGMICDPVSRTCRIQVGELCDGQSQDYCMTGTVCDFDSVCKLDLNGNCTGFNSICRSGTYCDWLDECKQGIGVSCSDTENTCTAGASCSDSVCVCDEEYSIENGALCEPKPGRYGAVCGTAGGECDVDNSKCSDGYCVCEPGHKPDHDFRCVNPAASGSRKSTAMFFIVIGSAAAFCLLVFSALAYRREVHKKRARQAAVSLRQASMKSLQHLSQSVTDMSAVTKSVRTAVSAASTSAIASEVSSSGWDQTSGFDTSTMTSDIHSEAESHV